MRLIEMRSKCRKWCVLRIKPTARIMAKIDSEFRHIADYKKSRSLLKKHLTEDMFNLIKARVTPHGSTLLQIILSGIENIESVIGVYAPDGDAYYVFSEIFDPIIQEYHGTICHPITEYGCAHKIINMELENKHIIWTKISCNRSLCGFPFNLKLTEHEFLQIEKRVSRDLLLMNDDLKGYYESLVNKNDNGRWQLIKENYCLKSGVDKFLKETIGFRHWPMGRGVFFNHLKNFFVWINMEDHLRIISLETGPNLRKCYERFVVGVKRIGTMVGFMRDNRLGYLNFCPSNLGTGMEIVVEMRLHKLPKHRDIFENICQKYSIDIECACTGNQCISFVCTVIYKPKLGMTEFDAVKWMQDAILHILRTELHI